MSGLWVFVDGFTGSGKSTVGSGLAREFGGRLVALDDCVQGWDALASSMEQVAVALRGLAGGGRAVLPQWDWVAMAPGEPLVLGFEPVYVFEGSGALYLAYLLGDVGVRLRKVWVDAPDGVRHERIARRDDYQWDVANWEAQERFCKRSWAGLDGFVDQVIVNQ